MTYSVDELRNLYKRYHDNVHTAHEIPCDACPGDPCSAQAFFDWLEAREETEYEIVRKTIDSRLY